MQPFKFSTVARQNGAECCLICAIVEVILLHSDIFSVFIYNSLCHIMFFFMLNREKEVCLGCKSSQL